MIASLAIVVVVESGLVLTVRNPLVLRIVRRLIVPVADGPDLSFVLIDIVGISVVWVMLYLVIVAHMLLLVNLDMIVVVIKGISAVLNLDQDCKLEVNDDGYLIGISS